MSSRSQRLKPVVKFAERAEHDAAHIMAQCQRALDEHERRLAELLEYRRDYVQRFRDAGFNGIDAMWMQDYRTFLDRLNEAVTQQRRQVEVVSAELKGMRREWNARRSRTKALDKVASRYRAQERRARARCEQGECDERAQHINGRGVSTDGADES